MNGQTRFQRAFEEDVEVKQRNHVKQENSGASSSADAARQALDEIDRRNRVKQENSGASSSQAVPFTPIPKKITARPSQESTARKPRVTATEKAADEKTRLEGLFGTATFNVESTDTSHINTRKGLVHAIRLDQLQTHICIGVQVRKPMIDAFSNKRAVNALSRAAFLTDAEIDDIYAKSRKRPIQEPHLDIWNPPEDTDHVKKTNKTGKTKSQESADEKGAVPFVGNAVLLPETEKKDADGEAQEEDDDEDSDSDEEGDGDEEEGGREEEEEEEEDTGLIPSRSSNPLIAGSGSVALVKAPPVTKKGIAVCKPVDRSHIREVRSLHVSQFGIIAPLVLPYYDIGAHSVLVKSDDRADGAVNWTTKRRVPAPDDPRALEIFKHDIVICLDPASDTFPSVIEEEPPLTPEEKKEREKETVIAAARRELTWLRGADSAKTFFDEPVRRVVRMLQAEKQNNNADDENALFIGCFRDVYWNVIEKKFVGALFGKADTQKSSNRLTAFTIASLPVVREWIRSALAQPELSTRTFIDACNDVELGRHPPVLKTLSCEKRLETLKAMASTAKTDGARRLFAAEAICIFLEAVQAEIEIPVEDASAFLASSKNKIDTATDMEPDQQIDQILRREHSVTEAAPAAVYRNAQGVSLNAETGERVAEYALAYEAEAATRNLSLFKKWAFGLFSLAVDMHVFAFISRCIPPADDEKTLRMCASNWCYILDLRYNTSAKDYPVGNFFETLRKSTYPEDVRLARNFICWTIKNHIATQEGVKSTAVYKALAKFTSTSDTSSDKWDAGKDDARLKELINAMTTALYAPGDKGRTARRILIWGDRADRSGVDDNMGGAHRRLTATDPIVESFTHADVGLSRACFDLFAAYKISLQKSANRLSPVALSDRMIRHVVGQTRYSQLEPDVHKLTRDELFGEGAEQLEVFWSRLQPKEITDVLTRVYDDKKPVLVKLYDFTGEAVHGWPVYSVLVAVWEGVVLANGPRSIETNAAFLLAAICRVARVYGVHTDNKFEDLLDSKAIKRVLGGTFPSRVMSHAAVSDKRVVYNKRGVDFKMLTACLLNDVTFIVQFTNGLGVFDGGTLSVNHNAKDRCLMPPSLSLEVNGARQYFVFPEWIARVASRTAEAAGAYLGGACLAVDGHTEKAGALNAVKSLLFRAASRPGTTKAALAALFAMWRGLYVEVAKHLLDLVGPDGSIKPYLQELMTEMKEWYGFDVEQRRFFACLSTDLARRVFDKFGDRDNENASDDSLARVYRTRIQLNRMLLSSVVFKKHAEEPWNAAWATARAGDINLENSLFVADVYESQAPLQPQGESVPMRALETARDQLVAIYKTRSTQVSDIVNLSALAPAQVAHSSLLSDEVVREFSMTAILDAYHALGVVARTRSDISEQTMIAPLANLEKIRAKLVMVEGSPLFTDRTRRLYEALNSQVARVPIWCTAYSDKACNRLQFSAPRLITDSNDGEDSELVTAHLERIAKTVARRFGDICRIFPVLPAALTIDNNRLLGVNIDKKQAELLKVEIIGRYKVTLDGVLSQCMNMPKTVQSITTFAMWKMDMARATQDFIFFLEYLSTGQMGVEKEVLGIESSADNVRVKVSALRQSIEDMTEHVPELFAPSAGGPTWEMFAGIWAREMRESTPPA